ncbi:MAG: kelch repeat-containing protein [Sandaracinus sp.]
MRTTNRRTALTILSASLFAAACSTPPATQADGGTDAGATPDAGPFAVTWQDGPDFPEPIAFGSAMFLPGGNGVTYLYVFGGSGGSYGDLTPFYSQVRRAALQGDNSLGPWEDAGALSNGTAELALAGHGAIRVFADDGANGVAIAGGGGPGGTLPVVLAGYVQSVDQSFGMWGAFPPTISAAQGGHVFGSFNSFEAHQLALVGGSRGGTALDTVILAATEAGTTVPDWRDGPALPTPRYGHGSVQVGATAPDIYLVGGRSDTEALGDVLVSVRDASLEVTGWATAGTLEGPVVFPQTTLVGSHLYVIGGVDGDPVFGTTSTRVRRATATAGAPHGTIDAFVDVDGAALPEGRAAALVATIGPWVYLVGGITSPSNTATSSVVYARLEP